MIVSGSVYFDCNATTPVHPDAATAALEVMRSLYGNPSSPHLTGLQAKSILENSRTVAANVIGADPEQITFTSGATESIQTAVFSVLQSLNITQGRSDKIRLLVSAVEHKAVPEAIDHWLRMLDLQYQVVILPVDNDGRLKLSVLEKEIQNAALLCTMAVNNETGVYQDLDAIEKILLKSQSKAYWLVDCVQALGKLELKLKSSRIDYAAFSGHKVYAPKGVGFLYAAKTAPFYPLIVGGGQEKGHRSGTENLPGIAAMGAVLQKILDRDHNDLEKLYKYRDKIVEVLKQSIPGVQFNTPFKYSVPTTIHFSVPGLTSLELLDLFDSGGIRLSAGSACNSASPKPSHVLEAMGLGSARCVSAVRLSFGMYTPEAEIEKGCQLIRQCASALKNTCLVETVGAFEPPTSLRDGIIQLRSGPSNTWLIVNKDQKNCIIIDPCDTVAERIENYIRCQKLRIEAILDTHSHADHESIRPVLQKILKNSMESRVEDCDSLGWPSSKAVGVKFQSVTLDNSDLAPAIVMAESESEGDLVMACIPTPGHTADSHTFLYGRARNGRLDQQSVQFVFPGDTVLSGGLGRTNFSASDPTALFNSLRKLNSVVSTDALLCPAHDYNNSFATSLKTELKENPLLALALSPMTPMTLESFLTKKKDLDTKLAALEADFQTIVCGVTQSDSLSACAKEASLSISELKKMLSPQTGMSPETGSGKKTSADHQDQLKVIDVREYQEYSIYNDWGALGLKTPPKNVPLSRFVNFMEDLLKDSDRDQKIVLICRTGSRSLLASKSLRRLGFSQVWSLAGGLSAV